MAKLADAQCSERCARKGLGVRLSPAAQNAWVGGGTWYTRMLEVHVPQGVEVQLLSDPHHIWTVSSAVDLPDFEWTRGSAVERLVYTEKARGSNPLGSTKSDLVHQVQSGGTLRLHRRYRGFESLTGHSYGE